MLPRTKTSLRKEIVMKINDKVHWTFDGWSQIERVITDIEEGSRGLITYILDGRFRAFDYEIEPIVENEHIHKSNA